MGRRPSPSYSTLLIDLIHNRLGSYSQFNPTRIAKVEHEMGQYAELKGKLSSIMVREEDGPLEMLTDLGADCFAKVKVRKNGS